MTKDYVEFFIIMALVLGLVTIAGFEAFFHIIGMICVAAAITFSTISW
ncbi:MAG: hypothetical protein K6E91_02795 [Butyrivibrio sp.]|nr:hypothetical protein [Butyrivibrio sp.]